MAAPNRPIPTPDQRSAAHQAGAAPPWRLFVDTGGTFTDCLAVAPDGSTRRAKVLSSGTLRALVAGSSASEAAAETLRVRFAGPALPDGFLRGARVLPPQGRGMGRRVLAFDPGQGALRLDGPLLAREGEVIELATALEPPLLAAHVVTATPLDQRLPPIALRLATTRGTNALLERRGARTALVATQGFADLLTIGDQRRPDLFALTIRKPSPLPAFCVQVQERLDAQGRVLVPLGESAIAETIDALRRGGAESVVVALLHAWIAPQHERTLVAAIRAAGFPCVVGAAERLPTLGILPRANRASVDAFLGPLFDAYLGQIAAALDGGRRADASPGAAALDAAPLRILTSAGGLASPDRFAPADGLLSGPAGGVVGAAFAARRSGFDRAIGFDMGGTSTDVARLPHPERAAPPLRSSHRVGDVEIAGPALAIETVAAGGGSVIWLDGGHLAVGPASAGAQPGPACYGRGGPLTVTDADLLLGRLASERFEIPVDAAASAAAADALLADAAAVGRAFASREALLEAAIAIADQRMADAIAAVSIRQGVDPRDHALVAFGGAGGVHACAVAERLDVRTVLLPPSAGVLSALGLAAAPSEAIALRSVLRQLPEGAPALLEAIELAAFEARAQLLRGARTGPGGASVALRAAALLRRVGQESAIELELELPTALLAAIDQAPAGAARGAGTARGALDVPTLLERFRERYLALFGHRAPPGPVEAEAVRVVASLPSELDVSSLADERSAGSARRSAPPERPRRLAYLGGRWLEAQAPATGALSSGDRVDGPALLAWAHSSAWVPAGWSGEVDAVGAVVLRRAAAAQAPSRTVGDDGAEVELVAGRLQSIAVEMGELLRRTAVSVNVKERLDFSCGLLDAQGRLAANAPHVPVHLGALGPCVRSVRRWFDEPALCGGRCDVLVTNHPAFGGSHLPDLTVVTAVRSASCALLGFAASRAHHAELGGVRPGSMPPFATSLRDEAVVIPPTPLVVDGEARWEALERLLREAPLPSRAPDQNLADLAAAVQANAHGAQRLRELAAEVGDASRRSGQASAEADHGAVRLAGHFAALRRRAASLCRHALTRLPAGRHAAVDALDDGAAVAVVIDLQPCDERRGSPSTVARVDFTGSAGVHPAAFNATEAIVRSAVMYVLRLLVDQPLPLNEGLLDPIALHVPLGMLSPMFVADPARCPAVGAGNTETSQRVVDVLLAALGVAAASQGTMNNLLFGVDAASGPAVGAGGAAPMAPFGYYETIAGGSGATAEGDGADAVHVHMTNTRITDPEVLEHRHPVRLERFAVRPGSGGSGVHRGGCGVVREVRFLAPMSVSLLTQRRTVGAPGAHGGGAGEPGRNSLVAADGTSRDLGSCAALAVQAGDLLRLETPGGGGWGEPQRARRPRPDSS